jgi:hypothetical protein
MSTEHSSFPPPPPTHSEVPEGKECGYCTDPITSENYAEYLPFPPVEGSANEGENEWKWIPSVYCMDCLEYMIPQKWSLFMENLRTIKCAKAQRRMIEEGPPINFHDPKGMPCPNNGEIYMFWYCKDNVTKSAKLPDSLIGEEREAFIEHLKQFPPLIDDDTENVTDEA